MNDEHGGQVIDMLRPKSSIRDMLKSADPVPGSGPQHDTDEPETLATAEDAPDPLPKPGDSYRAYGRASNKPLPVVRFLYEGKARGLPYANLDSIDMLPSDQPGGSPSIVMRFSGIVARVATLSGRNLDFLFDMLSFNKIGWVQALPPGRDFRDGKETVVTGITVKRIEELPE